MTNFAVLAALLLTLSASLAACSADLASTPNQSAIDAKRFPQLGGGGTAGGGRS